MGEKIIEVWDKTPEKGKYLFFFALGAFSMVTVLTSVGCESMRRVADKYESDSYLEEMAEGVIEYKLGLPEGSIDLSPFSPEDE